MTMWGWTRRRWKWLRRRCEDELGEDESGWDRCEDELGEDESGCDDDDWLDALERVADEREDLVGCDREDERDGHGVRFPVRPLFLPSEVSSTVTFCCSKFLPGFHADYLKELFIVLYTYAGMCGLSYAGCVGLEGGVWGEWMGGRIACNSSLYYMIPNVIIKYLPISYSNKY